MHTAILSGPIRVGCRVPQVDDDRADYSDPQKGRQWLSARMRTVCLLAKCKRGACRAIRLRARKGSMEGRRAGALQILTDR